MKLSISPLPLAGDEAFVAYQNARRAHWDAVALGSDRWRGLGGYYHDRLAEIYRFLIPPGRRVLELGCGRGDLLAAVQPSLGVGVEFSGEMATRARSRHPELNIEQQDAHELDSVEKFDFVVLSDLVNDLWDVQTVLEKAHAVCTPRSRLVINTYSRVWELPLAVAERLGLAKPSLHRNWLTVADLQNLLDLAGFETVRTWSEVLWPVRTPVIASLFNRFLVRLWPFRHFALTNFLLARPRPSDVTASSAPRVSVIVPARNEAGNVPAIFARTPEMGVGTEIVFVEGHSTDGTYAAVEAAMRTNPSRACRLLRQTGAGKGNAVREGFTAATGDVLVILDADLTVPPEDLPRFVAALVEGKGEFINGVRLVYPMADRAMRFANLLANNFFSLSFSWLLGQPVKDTLCGTKVLWREDYRAIAANRLYFGDFDPFGDFDLLFGAAKLGLKIVDLPIRYRERTYGTTNIKRWRHGLLLLRMVWFAARRIKFV